jgi:hypothetical protein
MLLAVAVTRLRVVLLCLVFLFLSATSVTSTVDTSPLAPTRQRKRQRWVQQRGVATENDAREWSGNHHQANGLMSHRPIRKKQFDKENWPILVGNQKKNNKKDKKSSKKKKNHGYNENGKQERSGGGGDMHKDCGAVDELPRGGGLVYKDCALFYVGGELAARGNEDNENENNEDDDPPGGEEYQSIDEADDEADISSEERPGGEGYQAIDCSLFNSMDDFPPECQESDPIETVLEIPGTITDAPEEGVEDGNIQQGSAPENLISVKLKLGFLKEPAMNLITAIVSRVMSRLLDSLTSFDCRYFDASVRRLRPLRPDEVPTDEEPIIVDERDQPLDESWQTPWPEARKSKDDSKRSKSTQNTTVQLYHAWTNIMDPTIIQDDEEVAIWYTAQVDYGAFLKTENDKAPKPIRSQDTVGNITKFCQYVVNRAIASGDLLEHLLQAVEKAKDEQDPEDSTFDITGEADNEIIMVGVAIAGLDEEDSASVKSDETSNRMYTEPLELEWGPREWSGLVLFWITLIFATTLTYCATVLQRKQSTKQRWGAVLTEHGVSSILQVGYRYHTQEGDNQLFLQVYDKGKAGYNDDNSVLQGGVEQEVIATGTLPTAAPTTMTPGGTLSSSGRDEHSQLPSSSFTASTPEQQQRSHNYEEETKEPDR